MNTFKKTIFYLVLASLILTASSIFFLYPRHAVEEGKHVFSSELYADYRKQLRAFVHQHPFYEQVRKASPTSFNLAIQTLIEEIEKPLGTAQKQRQHHEAFVHQLRSLAESSYPQDILIEEKESRRFFEDIIRWVFLGANLKSGMENFLFDYTTPFKKDLFEYVQEMQKTLRNHPQFNGIEHESAYEDQFLHGNLPSNIAEPVKNTVLIRLGQPLRYLSQTFWWLSLPIAYPEFVLFLHLQPSHLYVNLMKRKGVEGPMTQAIEKLEEQIPNLFVITLDKNSSFYWQEEKEFPDLLESLSFKEIFFQNMSTSLQGNYFWSKHLDANSWNKELKKIIGDIHRETFHDQLVLDRAERQDFIELTYLAILDRLVEKWHPASMNITCRQCVDRGPSLMALWLYQNNQLENREIAALLLAPPLLVRSRASHSSNIQRFVSAANRVRKTQIGSRSCFAK